MLSAKVESGERLVATDITDLTFFPIGSILMMDGSWTDGRGGWYICDGEPRIVPNPNGDGNIQIKPPDLRDRFIKGTGSSPNTGGSNALTADMLPKHTHSIYTDKTKKSDRTVDKSLTGSFPGLYRIVSTGSYSGIVTDTNTSGGNADGWADRQPLHKINIDTTHEHTGNANADNSVTDGATNTSNMPAYYSLIYIRKCV
jgi:hypothetical protein